MQLIRTSNQKEARRTTPTYARSPKANTLKVTLAITLVQGSHTDMMVKMCRASEVIAVDQSEQETDVDASSIPT